MVHKLQSTTAAILIHPSICARLLENQKNPAADSEEN